MSSALWLMLYLLPLLGLTAAVFAWFGWQWRGTRLSAPSAEGVANEVEPPSEAAVQAPPSENDLIAVCDERAEASQHQAQALKALEEESARLLRELELVRAERDQAAAALAAAREELVRLQSAPPMIQQPQEPQPADSVSERLRRRRSTVSKPKKAALTEGTLGEKIAALDEQFAQQQASMTALAQERDDWQRQVAKLEGQTPIDAAGLGLTRRSLADSTQRLEDASADITTLQNQIQVLRRVEASAESLAGVPDDDLTRIKGIKKIISEQLRAHGIHTWRQIALWDDEELRVFSELLAFKNRATREKWKEQARALHEAAHGPLS